MPYYKVPAIIQRDVSGKIVSIRPSLPSGNGGCGDTNALENQLPALDAASFYIWATANPIVGLIALTTAQRNTELGTIATARGRNVTRLRTDAARWESDQQAIRDRQPIPPRERR